LGDPARPVTGAAALADEAMSALGPTGVRHGLGVVAGNDDHAGYRMKFVDDLHPGQSSEELAEQFLKPGAQNASVLRFLQPKRSAR
jgi:hypothetical protein